ncbi:sigma-54 dependent transcriptional regulator [Desulfovibrio aminophilus]|nr:sigma-54 dependent transcriptional regulator [Desulfovibrio aminophilus]MCM0754595.1 sigma-54 dependent transcriptional regulator [Desulfovibrio aminophilus]
MKTILVCGDPAADYSAVERCYEDECRVERFASKAPFQKALAGHPDLAFIDVRFLGEGPGRGSERHYERDLAAFAELAPQTPVFVLCPPELTREAVKAVKAGAANYLILPLDAAEIAYVTESLEELNQLQHELDYLRGRFWKKDPDDVTQTNSPAMREVFRKLRRVAPTRTTVLLTGETGVGKGTMARLVHLHSNRAAKPFIAVHCGAIPETLIESELFGHEKGAFTGAVRQKLGKFEIASGGTIFLDEVGTLPPSSQVKLLGVLQDRSFQRVGGERDIEANVRIIAATNENLKQLCRADKFRTDLYYRLNVFPVELPPLRERVEDIPLIAAGILARIKRTDPSDIRGFAPSVLEAFRLYPWPGNVRELENVIERAYILESSDLLGPESFPAEMFTEEAASSLLPVDPTLPLAEARRRSVDDMEERYLREVLTRHKGRIADTAKHAGITTRQLHKLMTRHGLKKESFK